MGIGYNLKATGREIKGMKDFFDPAFAGRVSGLDDAREMLGTVLIYLGYSPNTTQKDEIDAARDLLVSQSKQIASYAPDTGQDLLAEGQVDMAFEWSGDILQLVEENPDIRYVIPEEGSLIWTDNMCIPASAPHKELAEKFINYILEPEVGAALSDFIHYATPNMAALPLINEADRNNPALYPPDQVRASLFFLADVGPEATSLYDQAWAQVMSLYGK
jgi:spermidine/putrescine transport system substrate-binding protein